jgi:hypothetical protein
MSLHVCSNLAQLSEHIIALSTLPLLVILQLGNMYLQSASLIITVQRGPDEVSSTGSSNFLAKEVISSCGLSGSTNTVSLGSQGAHRGSP